jgi:type II secretory pathway component PulC
MVIMSPRIATLLATVVKDARFPFIIMGLFAFLTICSLWQMVAVFKINDHPRDEMNQNVAIPSVIDISQQHLFGQYDESLADLPPTSLQLTLQGIVMGLMDSDGSRVLIAAPNQSTKVYKVGDSVAGGVSIRQILRDRVILEDNGRLESLNLPVPEVAGTITQAH